MDKSKLTALLTQGYGRKINAVFLTVLFMICGSCKAPESTDSPRNLTEVNTTTEQMTTPVYEIAVRKVKPGKLDDFTQARSRFIGKLKAIESAEIDREFQSFYALPTPDDTEVFIGMTKWSSIEAAGAAAEKLMQTPEAGAFFSTLDFKAYVMVRPIEGPDFDLSTIATKEGTGPGSSCATR